MKTIKNKEEMEILKRQIGLALKELSKCETFVSLQDINDMNYYEYKTLGIICDRLENLWEYLDFCIDNDLYADICDPQYNLAKGLFDFDAEDYKLFFKRNGRYKSSWQ